MQIWSNISIHYFLQDDFKHLNDYVTYVWARELAEGCPEGVEVTFSGRYLSGCRGSYRVAYISNYKDTLLGLSEEFQVHHEIGFLKIKCNTLSQSVPIQSKRLLKLVKTMVAFNWLFFKWFFPSYSFVNESNDFKNPMITLMSIIV